MAITFGVMELEVWCDLLLIVSQVNGEYAVKDDRMAAYLKVVIAWKTKFRRCDSKQVPRSENSHADSLVTFALAIDFQFRHEIPIEHISKPSIHKLDKEVFRLVHHGGGISSYLSLKMERSPKTRLKLRATIYRHQVQTHRRAPIQKIIFQNALRSLSEVSRARESQ